MDTIIFFDLENTLIWDWIDNPRLMCSRHPEISDWIKAQGTFRAGLFSWAVWNDHDVEVFNRPGGIRDDIEITHKFKFDDNLIITRDLLFDKFRVWLKMPFLRHSDEVFDFFKKRQTIQELWLREFNQPNTRVILLDDTVEPMTMINHRVENNRLELVDPWSFIKEEKLWP
jgi:hypothetical protein